MAASATVQIHLRRHTAGGRSRRRVVNHSHGSLHTATQRLPMRRAALPCGGSVHAPRCSATRQPSAPRPHPRPRREGKAARSAEAVRREAGTVVRVAASAGRGGSTPATASCVVTARICPSRGQRLASARTLTPNNGLRRSSSPSPMALRRLPTSAHKRLRRHEKGENGECPSCREPLTGTCEDG